MLGLACGDAVGTTVEFKVRGTFSQLTDMEGGGPFNLVAGQWTDDTSMALCLASSLVSCTGNVTDCFDPEDQAKNYIKWRDEGFLSSTGNCFDIGNTVADALRTYELTGNPYSGSTNKHSAGNGSIMRLAPIPLYYYNSIEKTVKYAELSSKVTHGTEEAIDACHLLSLMIHHALQGKSKEEIVFNTIPVKQLTTKVDLIRAGSYTSKNTDDIKGSGYVIDSLEAALWCFHNSSGFEEAILKAANLGDDADTTAAICGQISGAFYGAGLIPKHWKDKLVKRNLIKDLTKKIYTISNMANAATL